jgi:hypothetical protein
MAQRQLLYSHALSTTKRSRDVELVSDMNDPVRLRVLPVDVDLSSAARLLCLGPRFEQAGDVQPHIEPDSVNWIHKRILRVTTSP